MILTPSTQYPWTSRGQWCARSLRVFAETSQFNDEFINGVPNMGLSVYNQACLFQTAVYSHISAGDHETLKDWTRKIPASVSLWAFGVCQNNHWMAFRIDWKTMTIGWYDSLSHSLSSPPSKAVKTLLQVSSFLSGSWHDADGFRSM